MISQSGTNRTETPTSAHCLLAPFEPKKVALFTPKQLALSNRNWWHCLIRNIQINSNKISVLGLEVSSSQESLSKIVGEETRKRGVVINGKDVQQLYYSHKGANLAYFTYGSKCKLSYVQFGNGELEVDFDSLNLTSKTDLKEIKKAYPKAFCNAYYYEEEDRYDILFEGDKNKEVYTLVFKKGKLSRLEVSWG